MADGIISNKSLQVFDKLKAELGEQTKNLSKYYKNHDLLALKREISALPSFFLNHFVNQKVSGVARSADSKKIRPCLNVCEAEFEQLVRAQTSDEGLQFLAKFYTWCYAVAAMRCIPDDLRPEYGLLLIRQGCLIISQFSDLEIKDSLFACIFASTTREISLIGIFLDEEFYYDKVCREQLVEAFRKVFQSVLKNKSVQSVFVCANELFILYSHLGKEHQLIFLFKSVYKVANLTGNWLEDRVILSQLPTSITITFCYYSARMSILENKIDIASNYLELAYSLLSHCDSQYEQRRQILILLVPIRIQKNSIPSPTFLLQSGLWNIYGRLVHALVCGNPDVFVAELEKRVSFFAHRHLMFLMFRLKLDVVRNLVQQDLQSHADYVDTQGESSTLKRNMLPLTSLEKSLNVSTNECVATAAVLICQSKIKGYVSHQHEVLVLSKDGPFPSS